MCGNSIIYDNIKVNENMVPARNWVGRQEIHSGIIKAPTSRFLLHPSWHNVYGCGDLQRCTL